jgi:long-subunit fatty acid transport protein
MIAALRRLAPLVAGFVAVLTPLVGEAQGPAALEFSFSNPGARAMGFGGAFAALADDATAAFANPAGLVQLLRPEVSVELRHWSYATPYNVGGRLEGVPTGIGVDTTPGLRRGVSHADINDVSFLSFVYPSGRWSLAVYRHELADFRSLFETQGIFANQQDSTGTRRFLDTRTSFDLDVVGVGVSCAYRATETFSVGLGVSRYDGTVGSEVGAYAIDGPTTQGLFAPNHYLPERLSYRTTITMDGTDWAPSGGFLWSFAPRLSLGGFYRQGPEFEIHGLAIAGPSSTAPFRRAPCTSPRGRPSPCPTSTASAWPTGPQTHT